MVVLPGRVAILRPAAATLALPLQQADLAQWLATWPELPPVPAAAIAGFIVPLDAAAIAAGAAGWAGSARAPTDRPTAGHGGPGGANSPGATPLGRESWPKKTRRPKPVRNRSRWVSGSRRPGSSEGWLGAEDVPADPPYGTAPVPTNNAAEQATAGATLRRQMLTELQQQRQEMEAREAAREHSIAQLRQQLAATPSAATEVAALQARLTAETQEKNRLAAAIEAARTEAEVRNRELEARMQQLGQQVAQLQKPAPATIPPAAAPAAPPPGMPVAAARPASAPGPAVLASTRPGAARTRAAAPAWRLQWPRVALVLLVLALIGVGAVAVQRYSRQWFGEAPVRRERPAADSENTDENLEAAAPTLFDIQPDTVQVDEPDSADAATRGNAGAGRPESGRSDGLGGGPGGGYLREPGGWLVAVGSSAKLCSSRLRAVKAVS